MEVILLEKIDNVGGIGDKVRVKSGFARNYLIPQGKATMATAQNIAKFEKIRAELEAKAAAELEAAKARAAGIEGKEILIAVQAGSEGRLFGSIGTIDIADAFAAIGVEVERSEIRLPDGPLRVVGTHEVEVHLHADLDVAVKVVLEGPEGIEPRVLEEADDDEHYAASEADADSTEEESAD